jgi:glycosyltransferase involved in cell wall biosynthesis
MKILINCSLPFALAHGGWQVQIEQTQAALQSLGLQVELVRWWDDAQTADLIHYFGRMPISQVRFAQQKGIKIVMAELLTAQSSRSRRQLWVQKNIRRTLGRMAPRDFVAAFNWESYRLSDALIALSPWQQHLMHYLFGTPLEKIFVVSNGVEDVFLQAPARERGPWLVCTATITPHKRVLELAEAAVRAQTPLWIIGRAFAEGDPYAEKFSRLARQHPQIVRYEGAIQDRTRLAQIYREARGFVLLSTMESLSLSALEAAACGCPLLLSDLPWARTVFGDAARYCPPTQSVDRTARVVRAFYDAAPSLPVPPKPPSWMEIGRQIKTIYERVLSPSR